MTLKDIIITLLMLLTAGTVTAQNKRRMEISIQSKTVDGKEVRDTVIKIDDKVRSNLKIKDISTEIPANAVDTIQVFNYMRKLTIKPSKDNKVRVFTTAYFDVDKKELSDEDYLKQNNIYSTQKGNILQIQIGSNKQVTDMSYPWKNILIGKGAIENKNQPTTTTTTTTSSSTSNTSTVTTTNRHTNSSDSAIARTHSNTKKAVDHANISVKALDSIVSATATTINNLDVSVSASAGNIKRMNSREPNGNTFLQIIDYAITQENDDAFINGSQTSDIELHLPAGKNIVIKSKYGNVAVNGKMNNIDFDLVSCALELPDIDNVKIKSQYSTISASDMKNAEVNLKSGSINLKQVGSLKLKAEFSNINIQSVEELTGSGKSSNFDILTAGATDLSQSFGVLRITTLKKDLKLNAGNTELKLFNIAPTVKNIDIVNRFATITMPLQSLNNYQVAVSGRYSSIFGIPDLTEEIINNEKNYSKKVGSVNLNIKIVCPNCTTDFR